MNSHLSTFTVGQLEVAVAGDAIIRTQAIAPEGVIDDLEKKYQDIAQFIADRAKDFAERLQPLGAALPSKFTFEVEVGIEVSSGIPFIAEGKGTGAMTITAEWAKASPAGA